MDQKLLEQRLHQGRSVANNIGEKIRGKSLDRDLFRNLQIFYQAFGFVECVRSTTISDVGYELAGIKGGSSVSREQQKTWVAALLWQHMKVGRLRKQAEAIVAAYIVDLLTKEATSVKFARSWFEIILDERRNLKLTYRQKKLSNQEVAALNAHYWEFTDKNDYPPLPTPPT